MNNLSFIINPHPHKFVIALDERSKIVQVSLRKKSLLIKKRQISYNSEKIIDFVVKKLELNPSSKFHQACAKLLISQHTKINNRTNNPQIQKKISTLKEMMHPKKELGKLFDTPQRKESTQVERSMNHEEIVGAPKCLTLEDKKTQSREWKRSQEAMSSCGELVTDDVERESETVDTISKLEHRDDYMIAAQKCVANNQILKAMTILEKYAKKIATPLMLVDICKGFDLFNDVFKMGTYKGIITVKTYNEQILQIKEGEESADGIHQSTEEVELILSTCNQGFFFYSQERQEFHALRLNQAQQLQIYDRGKKHWKECKAEDLMQLRLKQDDLCIGLQSNFLNLKTIWHHPEETRASECSPKGYFYHEAQEPDGDGFCAIHASNAFFGYQAFHMPFYFVFAREWIQEKLLIGESEYEIGAGATDARQGSDHYTLAAYIRTVAQKNLALKKYAEVAVHLVKWNGVWDEEELSRIPQSCDRVIVCYRGRHAVTIRKNSVTQKWYEIDSMIATSQHTAYDTLADALKSKDSLYMMMSIIY